VVGTTLYVFGGYVKGFNPSPRVDTYDPSRGTWRRLADMPLPATHTGVATVGTDVFLAGGYIHKEPQGQTFATTAVWRYSTTTNTWTAMPPLPSARGSGALVAIGRVLHFFGGHTVGRVDKATHWRMDLDGSGAWVARAPMPNPRSHFAAVADEGKIWTIGGQTGQGDNATVSAAVNVYDPSSNTWSTGPSLPRPRAHISSSTVVVDRCVIVIGGDSPANEPIAATSVLDLATSTWTAASDLPVAKMAGTAGYVGGQICFIGGGFPRTATAWRLDLGAAAPPAALQP
jgi:N-acetylneuraminic acid mutarotase